ncbi:acyltransferase family protein [Microbacterium sp. HJ5]
MTSTVPAAPPARYAGLDGLRAIAVTLVIGYHLFPPAVLPAGFVGVDVFFVISGFLITSLLLREHDASGRIRLGEFWKRRARRLAPAMALVLTVCSTLAWVIGGDILLRLGQQVLGALTFSYNWIAIGAGTGYFEGTTPELYRNFWSLSVEEQFYVVWPLVLPLFLLIPRGAARAAAALALAAASAVWMGGVIAGCADPTRGYFGTDTHSFGILLGVALAFVLAPLLSRPAGGPGPVGGPVARRVSGCLGIAAVVGIGVVASLPSADGGAAFPGSLLVASVLTAAAIVAGVWPGSWFGPALDRPLRWIGDRSYGLYLWHWPLLVLAMASAPALGAEVPVATGIGVLAVTLVAAELSYRFVETPVRRLGFRASLVRLRDLSRAGARGRLRLLGVAAAGAIVLGGTSAAIAAAPAESTGETVVAAGQAALDRATRSPEPTPPPTPAVSAPAADPRPAASGLRDLRAKPSPMPSPTEVVGAEVSAVGDSVMLASVPALFERLPGIQVDAEVSRSSWAGPALLEKLAAAGELRPYVVVALGTNGPVDPGALERMAEIAGPDRHLILVNAFAPRDWIAGVNADLAAFADAHPGVVVADWAAAIAPRTDLLAGDAIHPGAEGGAVFAETVARSIVRIERERAKEQYARELRLYENLSRRPQPLAE